jgi:hypothetical protein
MYELGNICISALLPPKTPHDMIPLIASHGRCGSSHTRETKAPCSRTREKGCCKMTEEVELRIAKARFQRSAKTKRDWIRYLTAAESIRKFWHA